MRGGYKLINLKGMNILTITLALGVFGAINDSYDKHIILHDFKVGDEKVNDVCVDPVKTESGYIIYNVYGYDITIGENDEIEVVSTAMAKKSDIETVIGQAEITAGQIDSGEATSGQILTADGEGGVSWGNPPAGGTKLYRHKIVLSTAVQYPANPLTLFIISTRSAEYSIQNLYDGIANITGFNPDSAYADIVNIMCGNASGGTYPRFDSLLKIEQGSGESHIKVTVTTIEYDPSTSTFSATQISNEYSYMYGGDEVTPL